MPDAFDSNAQDVGLSLDMIEEEIEAGLPLHADRLVSAFDNEEYYAGRNAAYIQRRESEDWRDYIKRPKRTSKLLRKVIRTLANTYAPGPGRKVAGGTVADSFLQDVYKQNHINDFMVTADRRASLNGFCAIQPYPTGRPAKPVQLYLWGAHEIVVWTWPDDPTEAWAVATITRQRRADGATAEQRLRYDAWSRDEHRVYLSRWVPVPTPQQWVTQQYRGMFSQATSFFLEMSGEPAGSGKNPYGVLPFSFVHDETPTSDFYEGGIGGSLRECNAEIDRELSDLAQHARECMDPDRFTTGVSPSWRREKKAGNWQQLTPNKASLEDGGAAPNAFLVQPALNVELIWHNCQMYANTTLEDLDVPLSAVRMDASTDLSGIAIVAKQVPLIERARCRQPRMTEAETALASVVLAVAGAAYNQPALTAASVGTDLTVTWPTPRFPLPTPARDQQDAWELDRGVKSLVDVVAERGGFTTDQARAQIERVAEDNKWLETVMPQLETPQPLDPAEKALEQVDHTETRIEMRDSTSSSASNNSESY